MNWMVAKANKGKVGFRLMAKSELNDWGRPEYKRSDLRELVRGKYANLSKADRERVELEYHRLKPGDFDMVMSRSEATRARSGPKTKAEE